jgi:hypothetical protein
VTQKNISMTRVPQYQYEYHKQYLGDEKQQGTDDHEDGTLLYEPVKRPPQLSYYRAFSRVKRFEQLD